MRETERQKERLRETETDRERNRETERQKQRQREAERSAPNVPQSFAPLIPGLNGVAYIVELMDPSPRLNLVGNY